MARENTKNHKYDVFGSLLPQENRQLSYDDDPCNKDDDLSKKDYKLMIIDGEYTENEDGTIIRVKGKVGRNDPCPCGSGKKYKKCCGR